MSAESTNLCFYSQIQLALRLDVYCRIEYGFFPPSLSVRCVKHRLDYFILFFLLTILLSQREGLMLSQHN